MNNHSENINEIATALAKCQGEMSFAAKDSLNPHFKSKYADLSAVWDAIREPLSKHGLSVSQIIDILEGKPILISLLMHTSGQWIKSVIPVINANNTSQGQGSGLTYARRYALAALVGCVQDDDDGQDSMPKKKIEAPTVQTKNNLSSIDCIDQNEISRIRNLLEQCEPGYVTKLEKHLLDLGYLNYGMIPKGEYQKIVNGLNKNIEMIQKNGK